MAILLRPMLIIGLIAISATAGYTTIGMLRVGDSTPSGLDSVPTIRVNPFLKDNGTQLIAYVVAASDCGWSSTPVMIDAIGTLRDSLRTGLSPKYTGVRVVAVVLDRSVADGWKFVSTISSGHPERAFDQVVLGGSWLNEMIEEWVWREKVVIAASPQVFLVERQIDASSYLEDHQLRLESDRFVASYVGSSEVYRWLEGGAAVEDREVALRPGP